MTEVTDDGTAADTLWVDVGSSRYPVVICDDAPAVVAAHVRAAFPGHACCVISDDLVAPLHAQPILDALDALDAGGTRRARLLRFPHGEASKNRAQWAALTDAMIDARFGRDTVVVAVGGGVTTDLAGFVAATYMRGLPVVQVPTSLVAMVDAAIGGKTGIDAPGGRNLIGAFHQPSAVVVDCGALGTLPELHIREGLVEALKHGAIVDATYFDRVLTAEAAGLRVDPHIARQLVEHSIRIKVDVASADPLEQGRRAILNFGHTFGHAIEQATGYGASHGQAVAHGMILDARLGEEAGVTEAGTAARLEAAVEALGLPPLPPFHPADVLAAVETDKKNRAGSIRMPLLHRIGHIARDADGGWTREVPRSELSRVLTASPG